MNIKDKGYSTLCPKCKAPLHFQCMHMMRMYREVNGKRVFDAQCPSCHVRYDVDGGKE